MIVVTDIHIYALLSFTCLLFFMLEFHAMQQNGSNETVFGLFNKSVNGTQR